MRSVVLSIVVHVILGAIVVMKVRARVIEPEPVAAAREPGPIEVEIYVAPPVAAPSVAAPAPAGPASPVSRVRSGARPSRGGAVVTTPAREGELPPGPMAAQPIATVPSPHDAAEAAHLPAPGNVESAPPAAPHANTNTFRMRVDRDGTAHLTDRGNLQWGRGGSTAYGEEHEAERWLDEHHEQSNAVEMKVPELPIPVAIFDATDAAMRLAGQDPYAYEKLKALDATRDERARIGARHHERQLLDTPALVRASLADIARLRPDQRAAAIRELYLECDDSPAGEVARATIADYVRTQGLAIDLRSSASTARP